MGVPTQVERIIDLLEANTDAFANTINERTNVLDLAAHYPISPERWTLEVDGTRVFPQYGSVTQYTHDSDRHLLSPGAGETVVMRSAERPRYVVAYELAATFAISITQELQTGDSIRIGLYDGSDGYYLEHTGSQASDKADFVMERNGTEVYRKQDRDLDKALTEFTRIRLQTAWYNITRQAWEQSYADPIPQRNDVDESIQFNTQIATGDMGTERGPRTGNLPVYYEVTASTDTTGLELQAGSAAQVNLGNTTQFNRVKKIFNTDSVTVTGEWEPVRAFRIDPEREIVNVQFSSINVAKYTASSDVELLMMAADPSKVLDENGDPLTDSDFTTPEELSDQNNVMQQTTAVEQSPDSTGTPQTSMANPGGWQLGRSELLDASGNDIGSSVSLETNAKRPIYSRDYGVILLKSGNTGDASYAIQSEQDW